jgi:hypothetical protein
MFVNNFSKLIVSALLFVSLSADIHKFTSDSSPLEYIYKADSTEVLKSEFNYSFKDSSRKHQNNITWSQYTYPHAAVGCDVLLLDPKNPENLILFERKDIENAIALPGGFLIHMITPLKNAIDLFHYKIGLEGGKKVPLDLGTAGLPTLEDMKLSYSSKRAPFLGMSGLRDRAPGSHIMAFSYHMVTTPESSGKFASADEDKVGDIVSCKISHLLAKAIDTLLPGNYKNNHYLKFIELPKDEELGKCAFSLHHDHIRQIFKFYQILAEWGLLDLHTGNATENKKKLKFLYQAKSKHAKYIL